MGTPFSKIFNVFLRRAKDYEILDLDVFQREYDLTDYLLSAAAEFNRLTYDDMLIANVEQKEFKKELDTNVINILVKGMLYYWYCPIVLNTENFENNFNLKDLPQYSPANLLDKLYANREYLENGFNNAINKYSYIHGGIEELKI